MSIKDFTTAVGRKVSRQILTTKKHSPKLLFAAGVVGIGATVVLACKATLKADEILDEIQNDIETVEKARAEVPGYGEREYQKGMAAVYGKATFKFAKLYGPALLVGIASIGALTGSHIVLTNRLGNLGAAYAVLDRGFRQYRARVIEEYGQDKDREFRHGVEDREVLIETEHGPELTRVKHASNPDGYSIYAKLFARDTSRDWDPKSEYNLLFLRAAQNYANDKLHSDGFLLLNDVYQQLGMERTKEGCVVGWVLNNPRGGDGYVDFGIWDPQDTGRFLDFMVGRDGAIWIDPNVDGVVYDLI